MTNKDEEKYGIIGSTIKNEVESGVQGISDAIPTKIKMAKNVCKFLVRDGKKVMDYITSSPEERAKAKKEKEAKEAAEKAEKDAADEAEKDRMKKLQTTYILHTAAITCSYAQRISFVVIPVSHGTYIHGVEQLNVGDSVPEVNIRNFGVCTSPQNPSVREEAKKVVEDVQDRKKGFIDRVMDIFTEKPKEKLDEEFIKMCAGDCIPFISTEWIDGKEDVLVDGKKAVLGRCKLQCGYGGEITFYTSGQQE